ncbi:uncharacterized protein BDZ99DRAFT_483474 [Mytilinidion resinicola]|uniref:Uncharacterized protein n=1 Tax=Mytilinidion resinicola TaxID=574789 RepID=A0A6A6XYQ1_9PEZI|nr:uncharacterized protein BDZ99DRAFT_483474 [Mytilinidion resinicola]KAF2801681.1 hypothetical protein BDZ99DRAFT_483474 [Mytilinidion resinicola]
MNTYQDYPTMLHMPLRPHAYAPPPPAPLSIPGSSKIHYEGNTLRSVKERVEDLQNANVDNTPDGIIRRETEALDAQDREMGSGPEEGSGAGSNDGDEGGENDDDGEDSDGEEDDEGEREGDNESDEEMDSYSESKEEDDCSHKVNRYTLGELLDDHNLCGCNVGHGGKSYKCPCCGEYLELIYEYTKAKETGEWHDTQASIDPGDDATLYYHCHGWRICECRLPNGEIPRVE